MDCSGTLKGHSQVLLKYDEIDSIGTKDGLPFSVL